MPIEKITQTLVQPAYCLPNKKRVDFFDTAVSGFVLETRPNGGKIYAVRYKDAHGQDHTAICSPFERDPIGGGQCWGRSDGDGLVNSWGGGGVVMEDAFNECFTASRKVCLFRPIAVGVCSDSSPIGEDQ